MDSLAFSRMNKWLTLFFANSFCIHYRLRELTIFKICFVNLLHIHYIFREFTYDLLSVPRIDFQCTIYFANYLLHYLLRELRWIYYLFRKFTLNFLSSLRILFEFTIDFENSPSTHYLFWEFTINSLSTSRYHFQCKISLANSLMIHFFRAFTFNCLWIQFAMNSLSV